MLWRVLFYVLVLTAPVFGANDLAGNPLVVDTASSGTAVWVGTPQSIQKIRWVGATTAGTAVIKDGAGHVKWAASCPLTATVDDSDLLPPLMVKGGIFVSTLSSGVLYIYLAP